MHGLTGGDWKRAAICGTAPVPDPPQSGCDLRRSTGTYLWSDGLSYLGIMCGQRIEGGSFTLALL